MSLALFAKCDLTLFMLYRYFENSNFTHVIIEYRYLYVNLKKQSHVRIAVSNNLKMTRDERPFTFPLNPVSSREINIYGNDDMF